MKKKENKGWFFSFEGGEGAGKTTLIASLEKRLSPSFDVVLTKEPGFGPFGQKIRSLLLDEAIQLSAKVEALLFAADRANHVENLLIPSLREGKLILCDRYADSSFAYQGVAGDLSIDEITFLSRFATSGLLPNKTFYLDLSPEEGFKRIKREKDRMEEKGLFYHQRVRGAFLSLAKAHPDRITIIDASQSIELVLDQVYEEIKKLIYAPS